MPPLESSTTTTYPPRRPAMEPSSIPTTTTAHASSSSLTPIAPSPVAAPPPPPPSSPTRSEDDNIVADGSTSKSNNSDIVTVVNQMATDAAGRPGVYTGQWLPGPQLPHDATTSACMIYDNTTSSASPRSTSTSTGPSKKVLKYVGGWEYGHWHGRGTAWLLNGDVWTGDFCDDFQLHGWGRHDYADGRCYEGQFVKTIGRQGTGKYTWPQTGAVYEGSFQANQRHGYGKYSDPSAHIEYAGEWKLGQYHGYGHYQWMDKVQNNASSNNNTASSLGMHAYRGNFVDGKPHGQGIQVGPDGVVTHEGQWLHGKPVIANEQQQQPQPGAAAVVALTKRINSIKNSNSSSNTNNLSSSSATPSPNTQTPAPQPAPQQPQRAIEVVHNQAWKDDINNGNNEWATYRGLWNVQAQVPCKNGTAEYPYGGSGMTLRYEGCFNDVGQYHGQGRVQFRNGDVYEGEFVTGRRHGKGIYRWKDGRQYTGTFQQDSRHGKGRLLYNNSDFYEGSFVHGKRHGNGRFIFQNGSMYQGEWENGLYHGRGTLVQPDGSTYTGTFAQGVFHGTGKEIDASGKVVYQGEYIEGHHADEYAEHMKRKPASGNSLTSSMRMQTLDLTGSEPEFNTTPRAGGGGGSGNEYNHQNIPPPHVRRRDEPACEAVVDQEIRDCQGNPGRYTGIVLSATRKPHGVGRLVYADGKRIHEGFWDDGSKEGHGRCLFFPQGDFHEGEYKHNLRNGPGRYQWKDGRLYLGDYKEDQRHGKGSFSYPSGERYEGMFKLGQRNGFGKFTFKGGFYEGDWKSGKYHGQGHLEWEGAVYNGAFAEGTFHGRGIKKEAATGKIIQQGTWNMGRFVLAATPIKILQEEEQGAVIGESSTEQINADGQNEATPSSTTVALNIQITPGEHLPVVAPTIDTPAGQHQITMVEPTLDSSMSKLALDDSDHAVSAATMNEHGEDSSNNNNKNDDDEGDDVHGDEPPAILDDGADLPPTAHPVELE